MSNILIIDDEPSIVEIINYALQTEGLNTRACTTGNEALTLLRQECYNLVILDIGLPDINGFELAKNIREISRVPIIFLTARDNEIDRVVGLELGADDYVGKPFSPRELSARVKAVLRRTLDNQTDSVQTENQPNIPFQVDEAKILITYFGQKLELSRTEFRLLKTLVQAPGKVFNRDQLMQHAWEHADVSMDRTVDTHIKTIRQKLKVIADEDPIITHRGIGYSLKEL